jgi:predicted NodU family carbamoyl transferase
VFEEPRVVARLAEMPEVASLSVLPRPGASLLALGAAADGAGLAPVWVDFAVGPAPQEVEVAEVVLRSGLRPLTGSAAEVLARGGMVARLRGPAGPGRVALGARCVLTRADDPGAAARLRRAMSIQDGEEPELLLPTDSPELGVVAAGALGASLRHGAAALSLTGAAADRVRSCLSADGRVPVQVVRPEEEISSLLHEVRRMTGCPGLFAWPLAEGDAPPATDPRSAVEVWRRSGAEALQLGATTVGRAR